MTLLKKLLIENENNAENRNTILSFAKEVLDGIVQDDDFIESAEVDENEKTVRFEFTQLALDTEAIADLDANARQQFHEEFALRIKTEHAELF